jgi:hypothetical protein
MWPISLTTLMVLGVRSCKQKRFKPAIPLLATQLSSALIWGCLAAFEVGKFNFFINGNNIRRGDQTGFRNEVMD